MKKNFFFLRFIFFALISCFIIGFFYVSFQSTQPPQQNETEKLIDSLAEFQTDTSTSITSSEEIRKLFQNVSPTQVPRIYIDKIPSDFANNGSKILFQKMLIPLVLRENEKLSRQRFILQILADKKSAGIDWTIKEMSFFNTLSQKYDSFLKKTQEGQLNDLLDKVDVIPPALVIAQAALFTNWGKTNHSSPFGQYAWRDETHYELKSFPTLIQAVSAYMFELNSSDPLFEWRYARNRLRITPNHPKTRRVISFLKQYTPDDPEYADKLRQQLTIEEIQRLENASLVQNKAEEK